MRSFRALLILAILGTAAHAENKDVAREAFHEGTLQYDLGDFKAALAAFKKAYLNYEDPAFLFNIAQCQRQLGDKVEALRTYRVFLSKSPDPKQRREVEKLVAELQDAIARDRAAATRPPTGTLPPSRPVETTEPPTPPQSAPPTPPQSAPPTPPQSAPPTPDAVTTAPAHPAAAVETAPAREKPLTKKGWFWGVLAGGAVVVAGAVALGVVFGTRHDHFIELTY